MAISTYTELQTAIGSWLNRSDLATQIPDFITLAEAELNKRLRCPENEAQSLAFAVTSRFTTLPTDFSAMQRVVLNDNPRAELTPISSVLAAGYFATARPSYYAITGNQIEVVPLASASTLELTYWRNVLPLASNSTTTLLTAHPDLYLFGACVQAAFFLDDSGMGSRFTPRYEQALAFANGRRNRLGSGMMVRAG